MYHPLALFANCRIFFDSYVLFASKPRTISLDLVSSTLTSHAVDDLVELVVAVGRVIAGGPLQNVLDGAEAKAVLGHTLL